jgi:arylsulfatase A-like enzyme
VHGFDEFYGNLYHLNAEEEPERPNYPPAADFPNFRENWGPRGVLKCFATDEDDPTEHPRWGRVGKQTIEDTGPLDAKRMETIDDDIVATALDFIERQHASRHPVLHVDQHDPHAPVHPPQARERRPVGALAVRVPRHDDRPRPTRRRDPRQARRARDRGRHDRHLLDRQRPHENSWPDAGTTPFRSEKASNWEGAFRIPEVIRWPGRIPAGSISNEMVHHSDWLPTFVAAAGDDDIVAKLKAGHTVGEREFRVHLDGHNLLPYLTGEVETSPRTSLVYFSDDGDVLALRYDNWKVVFLEQRCAARCNSGPSRS